jgi:hypothetical protein
MNKEQALNVIKQALDQAIKIGVCQSIDAAAVLYQAFDVINKTINGSTNNNTIS